jgi:hypothetical protein
MEMVGLVFFSFSFSFCLFVFDFGAKLQFISILRLSRREKGIALLPSEIMEFVLCLSFSFFPCFFFARTERLLLTHLFSLVPSYL